MTTRNLLLLTYHFPPSAASGTFRMLGFARHLPRHGWRVSVVAPPEMPWDPVDPGLAAQVPAECAFHAVPYPNWTPRVVRRFVPTAVWLPYAWSACRSLLRRERPDVVLTSGPPHVVHLLGLWLKKWHRLPWVADFRDPWILGLGRRLSLEERGMRYWEQQVFKHADRVIANAPNAGRLFGATYPLQAGKVVTLTNGFDPSPPVAPPEFTGRIRMLHAGEIYAGRDPLPLLDAIAELKRDPPAQGVTMCLDVMGAVYLAAGADLGAEVTRRGLGTEVTVRGQLPYHESLNEMARSDLLVLLDGPGRKIGVPAKLYEYLGAGRPILALAEPDGDTAHILRESGILHRIAPPKDAARIRQALVELARELAAVPTAFPEAARLHRFTRESLARELAGIMDGMLAAQIAPLTARPCVA